VRRQQQIFLQYVTGALWHASVGTAIPEDLAGRSRRQSLKIQQRAFRIRMVRRRDDLAGPRRDMLAITSLALSVSSPNIF
jgi:hypothetical protein